jgi:hypothetical protein
MVVVALGELDEPFELVHAARARPAAATTAAA